MPLSDLDQHVVADESLSREASHRHRKLLAAYGADRGRALSRLAEGLRDDDENSEIHFDLRDDVELILRNVADSILDEGD